ncbi:MAG: serine protease [Geobacteraceae bacterium]|nr:serine protease [Geobacteraceae bacterium]
MSKVTVVAYVVFCCAIYSFPASAEVITCRQSEHPFARGQCAVLHSTDPEGWLRGTASIVRETGQVDLQFQIETDSIASAPKGKMTVELHDKSGISLATIKMGEDAKRGGKSCGKADKCGITSFPLKVTVPVNVAKEVKSIGIHLEQTGNTFGPLNLPIGELSKSLSVKYQMQLASIDSSGQSSFKTISSRLPVPDAKYRIVGGERVSDGKYPWMAALYKKIDGEWFQVCGGSLIDKQWVLTAAHCRVGTDWLVVLGRTNLTIGTIGEVHKVKEVRNHQGYDENDFNNDIALIKLDNDSKLSAIALVTDNPIPETNMVVAGWGAMYEDGSSTVTLRHVKVKCIGDSDCNSSYPKRVTANMFCAGNLAGHEDSCQGDSGGPLFFSPDFDPANFQQAGIVSWGDGCARPNRPGVYTKLTNYRDWISKIINP